MHIYINIPLHLSEPWSPAESCDIFFNSPEQRVWQWVYSLTAGGGVSLFFYFIISPGLSASVTASGFSCLRCSISSDRAKRCVFLAVSSLGAADVRRISHRSVQTWCQRERRMDVGDIYSYKVPCGVFGPSWSKQEGGSGEAQRWGNKTWTVQSVRVCAATAPQTVCILLLAPTCSPVRAGTQTMA